MASKMVCAALIRSIEAWAQWAPRRTETLAMGSDIREAKRIGIPKDAICAAVLRGIAIRKDAMRPRLNGRTE